MSRERTAQPRTVRPRHLRPSGGRARIARPAAVPPVAGRSERARGLLSHLVAGMRGLYADWTRCRGARAAAAMAFHATFSLAPALLLLVMLGSLAVDPALLERQLLGEAGLVVGSDTTDFLRQILRRAHQPVAGGTALVALGLVVFGATSALTELKDSLDDVFCPEGAGSQGLRGLAGARLRAMLLILVLTVLLVLALGANAVFTAGADLVALRFGSDAVSVGRLVAIAITLVDMFLLCLVAFRVLPALRLPWGALAYGALLATVLFVVGCVAIALYASAGRAIRMFGAAGSFAVLLLWLYYSALAFFAGAVAAARRAHAGRVIAAAPEERPARAG